jgi:cystathionine beta-synthase
MIPDTLLHNRPIYDNILQTIGRTPLVRLQSIGRDLPCQLLVKMETFNPGGSIKDRIGPPIIEDAERRGLLKPGGTIVEATSGNTGVGLAITAALKGYKCIFVMPDKMSQEKINLLRAYGARVVITPTAVEPDDPRSYYAVARRLVEETPNAILANQYYNPANPAAHYATTGPELWAQTAGQLTHLIVGMGTGGTISGCGRYLKEQNPAVQIVGVDPIGSILYELHRSGQVVQAETYKVEGIGEDFLPGTTDLSVVDTIVQVNDRESLLMTRRLVREEGIFVGGSCGAAVIGALKYARERQLGPEACVVIILPDSGSRYLSKVFNDDWMRENGFLESSWSELRAGDVKRAESADSVITVLPTDPIRDVVRLMKQHGISQLPVTEPHGSLVGLVTEVALLDHLLSGDSERTADSTIAPLIDRDVPRITPDTSLEGVMGIFSQAGVAIIVDHDQVRGILTKIDLLDFLADRLR